MEIKYRKRQWEGGEQIEREGEEIRFFFGWGGGVVGRIFFFFLKGNLEEISFHTKIEKQQSQEGRDYIRSSPRILRIQGGGIPFQIGALWHF